VQKCKNLDLIGRIDKPLQRNQDTALINCSVIARYLNNWSMRARIFIEIVSKFKIFAVLLAKRRYKSVILFITNEMQQ
jgi:hypothetical protein